MFFTSIFSQFYQLIKNEEIHTQIHQEEQDHWQDLKFKIIRKTDQSQKYTISKMSLLETNCEKSFDTEEILKSHVEYVHGIRETAEVNLRQETSDLKTEFALNKDLTSEARMSTELESEEAGMTKKLQSPTLTSTSTPIYLAHRQCSFIHRCITINSPLNITRTLCV